jgi:DNA repair protein SbcC/Rad50
MQFKKLRLENIRSYDNLEISFPKGSILLAGEIGSGKTSILLGLQFALFGLQPGQRGSSILRQGEDGAKAHLELEVDGETIILERSIKRSKKGGITQDSNTISYQGRVEELSTSEMKDRVIGILNYPKEFVKKSNLLYKFTVYTPQEEMKAIIQEKPEVRLDTLRHIFGIDRYKRIKDNSTIFLQKIKDSIKIKEVLASELNPLKEKFAIENEKKIAIARLINNLTIEYKKLEEEEVLLSQKLQSLEKSLEEKRELSKEVEKTNIELNGKRDLESRMQKELLLMQKQTANPVDFSEERLSSVLELFGKHKRILDEKNQKFLELNSNISVLESQKEVPFNLREKIVSMDNCPTCFQGVAEEHKHKISKKTTVDIDEINLQLETKTYERAQIIKEIEKEKELIGGYESDKNLLSQNRIKYEHYRSVEVKIKSDAFIFDRTKNEIIQLNEKLEELELQIRSFEDFSIYEGIKEKHEVSREILRKNEILLATKNSELVMLKERLEELSGDILGKETLRSQVNHLKSLQEFIQDKFIAMIDLTEKNVLAKLRSEFSSIFAEWFSMLVSDELSVRLDEDFTPIITNQDYEIDYDFLSGGERTAIALAYRLSLNKVLNSLLSKIKTKGVVILDEPTDGFATEQIDKMRDIFDQLKAEQMILVSHEQKIEGFVDHVLRVRKDGVSLVE